jgi:release factor glutamine methyltransferase
VTTVREALAAATADLAAQGVPDAARDARWMLASAMAVDAGRLLLIADRPLTSVAEQDFERMVGERCLFRPVAKIIGRRDFWGRVFHVDDRVLDPRPETETLVAAALDGPVPARILDLGTGSGAILLSLLAEWGGAWGLGTDVDGRALAVARQNAERLGLDRRAAFVERDWCDGVEGPFELVVSNPPYIAEAEMAGLAPDLGWEPRHALTPGPTGLEAYRRIAAGLPRLLAPGGRVLLEIGPTQAQSVSTLLSAAGFARIAIHRDLDGRDRVVEAT